jgi:exopolysaccharide biosynthesis polyprenyl glycosylphosphotransferase
VFHNPTTAEARSTVIRRYQSEFQALLALADAVLAVAVLVAVSLARYGSNWTSAWTAQVPDPPLLLAGYACAWVGVLAIYGQYRPLAPWSIRHDAVAVAQATVLFALVLLAALYFLRLPGVSRLFLLAVFPIQAAATVGSRALLRALFRVVRRRGRNLRFILMVGTGVSARAFAERIESHPELGLRIVGFVGAECPDLPTRWRRLGAVDAMADVLHGMVVDEVAICLPLDEWHDVETVTALAEAEGKVLRIPVALAHKQALSQRAEELDGMPVVSLVPGPDRVPELVAKRLLDLVGAAAGLVAISPILLGAALAILVTDGRPVFFRQERAGLNGRPFRIVKFRTMTRDADARRAGLRAFNEVSGGASFKMTNDPRITPLGRWLRRTSIDELPQLWNVLRGEMSLVGPRPHPFDDVAGYDAWHRRRLSMKPGMTGLWQVGARRDSDFDRWVQQDLEYIDRWSLWLDLRLLISTIPALLRAEGR